MIIFKGNPIRRLAAAILLLMLVFPISAKEVAEPVAAEKVSTGQSGSKVSPFLSIISKLENKVVIKTNLLDYAILMPNLEAEWMFRDRWSAALELQGAWYCKDSNHKVYRLVTLIPEVRYWIMERERWHGLYAGAFVGPAWYDFCDSKKGHKGEGGIFGVSAGYMWPIHKQLSLDAEIGLGYMRLRDKEYVPAHGHFLYQRTKNINYVGPLRLKLSLVWRFQVNI